MNIIDIINKKRLKQELTDEEIKYVVETSKEESVNYDILNKIFLQHLLLFDSRCFLWEV